MDFRACATRLGRAGPLHDKTDYLNEESHDNGDDKGNEYRGRDDGDGGDGGVGDMESMVPLADIFGDRRKN